MSRIAHPYRRQLALNTVATSLTGVWAVLLAAATLPVVLHSLGAEAFGTWVLLQTLTATAGWMSIPTTALSVAGGRRVAQAAADERSEGARRVANATLTLFLSAGIAAGAAVALLGPTLLPLVLRSPGPLRDAATLAVVFVGLQIAAESAQSGAQTVLEGNQRVDLARALDTMRRTLVAAAVVAAAIDTGDLRWVAAAAATASVVSAVASLVFVRRLDVRPGSMRPLRGIVAEARTLAVLTGTGVLHRTMDRILVGAMFGPAAVALVEIASRMLDVGGLVLSASSYTSTSAAAWLDARIERSRLRELLLTGTRLSLIATWPVLVLAAVFGRSFVSIWVGPEHVDAAWYALFGFLYLGVEAPMQVGQNMLRGLGRADLVLRATAPGVALNLVASLVLLKLNGPVGAFQGTLVGSLLIVPILLPAILRAVDVRPGTFLRAAVAPALPTVVAMTLVGLIVLIVGPPPVVAVIAGVPVTMVAGGAAAFAWGVRREERELVRHLVTAGPSA